MDTSVPGCWLVNQPVNSAGQMPGVGPAGSAAFIFPVPSDVNMAELDRIHYYVCAAPRLGSRSGVSSKETAPTSRLTNRACLNKGDIIFRTKKNIDLNVQS